MKKTFEKKQFENKAAGNKSFEKKDSGKKTFEKTFEKSFEKKTDDDNYKKSGASGKPETKGKTGTKGKPAGKPAGKPTGKPAGKPAGKSKSGCPLTQQCGGCTYQGVEYSEQLRRKQEQVEKLFKGCCPVKKIVGMENPVNYRNKVHAVIGENRDHEIISGTYMAGSHIIVPVEKCMLEDEKADIIIGTLRKLFKSFKYRPYNEDKHIGLIRHVLIKRGFKTNEIMVVLVTATQIVPGKKNFVEALRKEHPEITTIIQNINDKSTSMVLGDKENVWFGKGYIEDLLCGHTFRISSKSFYQINPVQTELLYNEAICMAKFKGDETVIDAYCGIGTIGITAAEHVKKVIGVELNKDAVKDAIANAKQNKITNCDFYQGDAGKFMAAMAEDANANKADVVIMDPPRSGSTEEFMTALAKLKPSKVVYISCNPETQIRDIRFLEKKGYKAVECRPFDLFPFTDHVETVVLLSKGEIDSKKIKVEFSLEDMDMSGFQNGATYAKIKERVLEQSGLKVSSLYIAQVKQKCGIIVRENFNKAKSEDAKQPKCPAEKEKAIIEALKHFGMI